MVHSEPIFLPSSCRFFSQKLCVIFAFKAPIFRYTWCGRIFHLSCRRSYQAKEGGIFYLLAVWGGGGFGVSPRKFLKNGCKWRILSLFLPSSCRFFPKNCVYFCFQISDLLYTWCWKIFTLAVEEKPKRGRFYLLEVGGGSRSPRENILKNGCKWCIRSPFLPSSCRFFPLLYTWCGKIFTLAVEEKPKKGIFYLLAVVGGGGSGSPRENF